MSEIAKYILYFSFLFAITSCDKPVETKKIKKCDSGFVKKSNSQNIKINLEENSYEQKILKILKKRLALLKKTKLKNSINVDHYDSNISGNDTMLKFQFLLSSNGKVIDTVLLCSNTSENINKEILDSVMELNFGTVPKDSLKNGPIFGIAIPYSYSF